MSPTIERLRAANPVPIDPDRGDTGIARQSLERILSEPQAAPRHTRSRFRNRLPRGGVAVVIALGLAGGGAAFAATNPFGWWSSNPGQARYALNPSAHVRAPSAYTIGCRGLTCVANGHGQIYTRIDTIEQPGPTNVWTRTNFLSAVQKALARHKLTAAQAAKFRHDIAQVPDSFFSEMRVATRYATVEAGPINRVPPPGVPEFLICEQVRTSLSCQNLNGDQQAPIGAGVYSALQAPDWRPAPPQRRDYSMPPGIHFTHAEYQVLIDLAGTATISSSVRAHEHRVRARRS